MTGQVRYRRNWQGWWHLAAAGVGVAILSAWLLFGDTGLFAWGDYHRLLDQERGELARAEQVHARLVNHRALLDPDHVDPDYGDETGSRAVRYGPSG